MNEYTILHCIVWSRTHNNFFLCSIESVNTDDIDLHGYYLDEFTSSPYNI